jgi:hypothetical protein
VSINRPWLRASARTASRISRARGRELQLFLDGAGEIDGARLDSRGPPLGLHGRRDDGLRDYDNHTVLTVTPHF